MNNISVALYQPRIPQNTGNIARTCAAFNISLHLIKPLGFSLEDKYLKRAGLDYWPYVDLNVHNNIDLFISILSKDQRIIGFSKSAEININNFNFNSGDILLFGREDIGLDNKSRSKCKEIISIPMPGISLPGTNKGVRSLNLSVSAGIGIYQAGTSLNFW
tara:strand:+ start:70 stop:552 length:483 start_codon:yes stop_codon:yes gene_type:complete